MRKQYPTRGLRFVPLSGFRGDTSERGPTAEFKIGLCVGRREKNAMPGAKTPGVCIPPDVAKGEFVRLRARQVGARHAASTTFRGEGAWMGAGEDMLEMEIAWRRSPREATEKAFKRNMIRLGERVAERLGQREVTVRVDDEQHRVNAPYRKGPKPLTPGGRRIR